MPGKNKDTVGKKDGLLKDKSAQKAKPNKSPPKKPAKPKASLSTWEFIYEYMKDLNGTDAYLRCDCFKTTSRKVARVNASRLLAKANTQAALAWARKDQEARLKIDADNVLRELALIGFARMGDYAIWGPEGVNILSSENLPEGADAAVKKVKETRVILEHDKTNNKDVVSIKTEFELADKKGALTKLGEHLGVFKPEPNKDVHVHLHLGPGLKEMVSEITEQA